MIASFLRNSLLRCLGLAAFVLVLFGVRGAVNACSWDYPIWIVRSPSADPLYRFVQNDKAGYIDQTGRVVLQPQYRTSGESGEEFQAGLLRLGVIRAKYVDPQGSLVIDKDYPWAWDFSEGLAAAMPEGSKEWGYIDRSGEFEISPRFQTYPHGYVDSFSDGLAMIEVEKQYGYIDHTGSFVIKPSFLFGAAFHEGFARVVVDGPCAYSGEGPCPDYRLLGGQSWRVKACRFAFIDKRGALLTTDRYDDAEDFSEGLAGVRVGDKWGYIDRQGQLLIRPAFEYAGPLRDGLARVRQGELFGYVDRSGTLVIKTQYRYAETFSDGLAVVGGPWNESLLDYEEYYYINRSGQRAIAEGFRLASPFFKGLAHVRVKSTAKEKRDRDFYRQGTFAYIDVTGRKVFIYQRNGESAISMPARSNVMALNWIELITALPPGPTPATESF